MRHQILWHMLANRRGYVNEEQRVWKDRILCVALTGVCGTKESVDTRLSFNWLVCSSSTYRKYTVVALIYRQH
jgi:hypothetical protein